MSKSNWSSQKYRAYGYRPVHQPPKKKRRGWLMLLLLAIITSGVLYVLAINSDEVIAPVQELLSDDSKRKEEERKMQYAAALAENNQQLNTILSSWTAAHPSHDWAMVVQGLDGDERTAALAADTQMRAASLYKIFLLLGLFKEKSVSGLKTTTISYAGGSVTLDNCTDKMLRLSDNACGEAVGKYVGWANAELAVQAAGFSITKLNVAQPVTTAGETARLLIGLHNKNLFSAEAAAYTKGKLAQQTWNKGIPAGCTGCKTYNKTGDLGFVRHDAAIIENAASAYVLVIFSDGALYSEIAELTRQINTVMSVKLPT